MGRFEFLDHTADIRVRITGDTFQDLFVTSANALSEIIFELKPVFDLKNSDLHLREISIKEDWIEDLLVRWLNELASLFYTYQIIPVNYPIKINRDVDKFLLYGIINFIKVDQALAKKEVKAVTYSGLKIIYENGVYAVEVIFDI